MGTYRTGSDALLPLCHAQTLLQARALLHHHIPATVRVLGTNTGTENTHEDTLTVQISYCRRTPTGHFWGYGGLSNVNYEADIGEVGTQGGTESPMLPALTLPGCGGLTGIELVLN